MSDAKLIEMLMLVTAIGLLSIGAVVATKIMIALFSGKIDALDLISAGGKLSEEKIFTIVGKVACVFVMIKDASDGQPTLDLQLAMAALIFAHELLKRWQSIGLEKTRVAAQAPTGGTP